MLQVHAAARPFFHPNSAPPHRTGGGHPAVNVFCLSDHSAVFADTERHLCTENGRKNFKSGGCTSAILHSPTDSLTI